MIPLRQKPIIKQPVEENIPIISSIKEKSPSEKIVDEIKLVAGEKSNRYEAYYCEIISSGLTDWNVIKALTKKKNDAAVRCQQIKKRLGMVSTTTTERQ